MGVQKDHKPTTSPLSNTRSRELTSSTAAAAKSTPSDASQRPIEPSQKSSGHPRKAQKRENTAEDDHSQKRLRKDSPSASLSATNSQDRVDVWQCRGKERPPSSEDRHSYKRRRGSVLESQLSEENLKKLERGLEKFERGTPSEMDSGVTVPYRVRKRTPSRQASSSDLNQATASQRSQESSVSNSFYRYHILDQARIYIRPEPPPKDIQAQIDVIFEREIPEKRRRKISNIARKTSQKFIENLRGAHGQDDLVGLVYQALKMMHEDETFSFVRKGGSISLLTPVNMSLRANLGLDWDPSLKPEIQQRLWNLSALYQSNNKTSDVVDHPNKRQQGQPSFPTPDTSQSMMQPLAAPSQSKQDAVKTPRPDFTIGLRHSTVCNALRKRGLNNFKADHFLKFLQEDHKLCSDPTQNFLNVRFPIVVIEGKAYATGKTVFEAQNQAAVSGACMVNLQQLTDLFERVVSNTGSKKTHIAFSICTEGPQIEFWVHYALLEGYVRCHYMNIFRTCYGSLQGGLEDFLLDAERLMTWTRDEFWKRSRISFAN